MNKYVLIGIVVAVLVAGILVAIGFCVPIAADRMNLEPGEFGDMFGLANALFSGLAFSALIITLLMQHKELSLQRRDLDLTREEIAGQREALQEQNRLLERQGKEEKVGKLIEAHLQVVEGLRVTAADRRLSGDEAFWGMTERLHREHESLRRSVGQGRESEAFAESWKRINQYNRDVLTKYWQSLTGTIQAIFEEGLSNPGEYRRRLRGNMAQNEVAVLFYLVHLGEAPESEKALVRDLVSFDKDRLTPGVLPDQYYHYCVEGTI